MEMTLRIASDGSQLALEGDAPMAIDRQMRQIVTSRAELLGMLLMYEGRKLMKLTDQDLRDRTLAAELGLGAWLPIETAPASGVILLAVDDQAGERRTFVAEASHEGGALVWMITTGWTGWSRLHGAWTPISWQRLPQARDVI